MFFFLKDLVEGKRLVLFGRRRRSFRFGWRREELTDASHESAFFFLCGLLVVLDGLELHESGFCEFEHPLFHLVAFGSHC